VEYRWCNCGIGRPPVGFDRSRASGGNQSRCISTLLKKGSVHDSLQTHSSHTSLGQLMDIRKATAADIQDIAKVLLAATASESQWLYCFPSRREHPEKHESRVKAALELCLSTPDGWIVAVAEISQGRGQHPKQIVAVGIWQTQAPDPKGHGKSDAPEDSWSQLVGSDTQEGSDCHPSHLTTFMSASALGREKYLRKYDPQIHLHILATHPNHQKLGFGKALCNWGISWASEKKMTVSVMASSKGYIFFSGMGFRDVGYVTVKAEGESEDRALKAMVRVAGPERRRSSVLHFLGLD